MYKRFIVTSEESVLSQLDFEHIRSIIGTAWANCRPCGGSGLVQGDCRRCSGSGVVNGLVCWACGGKGTADIACPTCSGTGKCSKEGQDKDNSAQ